jgi:hypothetical protein
MYCHLRLEAPVFLGHPFLGYLYVFFYTLVVAPRRNRTTTALFSTDIFPIAILTGRLYLQCRLNIPCGTTLNNEQSCHLINKNRAIFILYIATVVRGSLTFRIFGLLIYTMTIARFLFFKRQDCSLLRRLSICHR